MIETIEARKIAPEPGTYYSNRPNKNLTLGSLIAVCGLLLSDNSEDFCRYYKLAMHDDNGKSIWNLIHNQDIYDKRKRERMRIKYQETRGTK